MCKRNLEQGCRYKESCDHRGILFPRVMYSSYIHSLSPPRHSPPPRQSFSTRHPNSRSRAPPLFPLSFESHATTSSILVRGQQAPPLATPSSPGEPSVWPPVWATPRARRFTTPRLHGRVAEAKPDFFRQLWV